MGKGHGQWARNNQQVLLTAFRDAVITYGQSVGRELPSNCTNDDALWEHVQKLCCLFEPDRLVYIQRLVLEDSNNTHPCELQVGRAVVNQPGGFCRDEVLPEFDVDGFPGASVMYPLAKEQWVPHLATKVLDAGLRISAIVTLFLVNVQIATGTHFQDSPSALKIAFMATSAAALFAEFLAASFRSWQALKQVLGSPDSWHSLHQSLNTLCLFASTVFLRFVGLPHSVLNAPDNTFAALSRVEFQVKLPILINVSRTARRYEECSGLFAMLPKMFLEDIVMAALKLLLGYYNTIVNKHEIDVSLLVAIVLAVISSALSVKKCYVYLVTVLDYDLELYQHSLTDDPFDMQGRLDDLHLQCFRELFRHRPWFRAIFGCRRMRELSVKPETKLLLSV
jgi:hypothetical protein